MRNVVIHQPQFLPFEGFWHRLLKADTLVLLGGAKFQQTGHQHRVTLEGRWETIRVNGHQRTLPIREIRMFDDGASDIHAIINRLKSYAAGKPGEAKVKTITRALFGGGMRSSGYLLPVLVETTAAIRDVLGLTFEIEVDCIPRPGFSAEMKLDEILKRQRDRHGPIRYLTAGAARNYLGPHSLAIPEEVLFQRYIGTPAPDTVAQLIADHEDPLGQLVQVGRFETYRGEPVRDIFV